MKTFLKLGTLSLVASAFLIGCGGSSSSSDVDTLTGYFVDAPVAGLSYKCDSGLEGVTDKQGRFQYKKGDRVHFSIGKLSFGDARPADDGLVTPKELTNDETKVALMLQTLQALDSDNDPSNGITISEDVVKSLQGLNQEVKIVDVDENSLVGLDNALASKLDSDYDGKIDVDRSSALAHFDNSLNNWHNGVKAGNGAQGNGHGKGKGKGNGNGTANSDGQNSAPVSNPTDSAPVTNPTQELMDSLAYMGNEERLANDIYTTLYDYHGQSISQFANITKAEKRHIGVVQDLVRKYNVDISALSNVENPIANKDVEIENMPAGRYDVKEIQDLYDALYEKGIKSKRDAIEVGCMVEVHDVNDLDRYIAQAEAANASDVVDGFKNIRNGSYNHYWSFDRALKAEGVENGCASLGAEYDKNGIYPQNEHGGNGQGHGRR